MDSISHQEVQDKRLGHGQLLVKHLKEGRRGLPSRFVDCLLRRPQVPLIASGRTGTRNEEARTMSPHEPWPLMAADGHSALFAAASRGDLDLLKLLFQQGTPVDAKDEFGRTALSHAAENGHTDVVDELLRRSAEIDSKEAHGRTPLSFAAENGHTGIAADLLGNGAKIDAKDKYERTPLSYSAEEGHFDVVAELLRVGAGVDVKSESGWTPLTFAALNGRGGVVAELLRNGTAVDVEDEYGRSALSYAAENGHSTAVAELLRSGADTENRDNESKRTPLSHAAENGHADIVAKLVESGAYFDAVDYFHRTPLSYAAEKGHTSIVVELLRCGAEPDTKDYFGRTPLSYAAENGHTAAFAKLLESGADIYTRRNSGRSPLSYASANGHAEIFDQLMWRHGDFDTKDGQRRAPISYAAEKGHFGIFTKLLRRGAKFDLKDKTGRTPLSYAAENGHAEVVADLLKFGVEIDALDRQKRTPLSYAAEKGHPRIVVDLLGSGAEIDTKGDDSRTPLSYAAGRGHSEVVAEILRRGADVDATDDVGSTALSIAAMKGHLDVVTELLRSGASTETQDRDSSTALSYAAQYGHAEVVAELIRSGAKIGADNYGKNGDGSLGVPVSSLALRYRYGAVVAEFLRYSAFDPEKVSCETVALFAAVIVGDLAVAKEFVAMGIPVDDTTTQGRTALFYAVEYARTDMVLFLIESGASVSLKLQSSPSRRESETPLTIAGRAGHMQIFQALVDAGAPVNVRSGVDGETPLISAARWDYFAGVQALISRGGSLLFKDVAEDEYPLLPGTLKTMREMCTETFEFESLCVRLVARQCSQAESWGSRGEPLHEDTIVSFASITFRICRLLLDIQKRNSPLSRFIGSRAITSKIQDFHEELDHIGEPLAASHDGDSWREQFEEVFSSLHLQFVKTLSMDDGALLSECASDNSKFEAAMLLQYELKIYSNEAKSEMQERIVRVLDRFPQEIVRQPPTVPDWFISRDEVDFHSWNVVRSNDVDLYSWRRSEDEVKIYKGKWCQSEVIIETSGLPLEEFIQTASDWYPLSHLHVMKLFGACHLSSPRFFVYESVAEGRPLHQFLGDGANRGATWRCLFEAALGLQYLHKRNIVRGDLRCKNIKVGLDRTTRLNVIREKPEKLNSGDTGMYQWMAPELVRSRSVQHATTIASDVYAFGMCIWEAVTLRSPWRFYAFQICQELEKGKLPKRPGIMNDAQWDLITKMCASDPALRVSTTYVVNRLKHFVTEYDGSIPLTVKESRVITTEIKAQSLEEHRFAEIEDTIPNTLRIFRSKCELLPDGEWMMIQVLPALEFMFALLQEQQKVPSDVEVASYCATLGRFQRYFRTAVSKNSVFRNARSRKVAETHDVVYSELDRLLDLLGVPDSDPVRLWRSESLRLTESEQVAHGVHDATSTSFLNKESESSDIVSLKRFGTSASSHEAWTRAGLATTPTSSLSWYLALKELLFNESDAIGQGSFGTVYKGLWLDTPVVVKFMGYEEDLGTIPTDLLLHEVRVWYRLSHPHVLKFYGACHVDKRYFVCEHASDGDMMDFLSKPGNETQVWQKMYEAALGLQYLHSQNVTHYDLKCDNIMVGMDGKAKLIDFGLSCLLNEAEIQIDVKQMGAVNWRSPEYLKGERPSFVSDVYSFAMCIIEAASGILPWGRPMSPAQIRFQWKKGNGPILPDLFTEKQKNLIHLMTKFDPSERVKMVFVVDKLNEIAQDQIGKMAPSS